MQLIRRHDVLAAVLACAIVAALLFVRISAFGIWDPWELGTADAARRLAAGEHLAGPASFSTWLVSLGFRAFGVHEWAGRTPIAFAGVLTALLAYVFGSRFAGPRVGFYAALVTGTSPLFIFNARAMLGDAPSFAVQTAVGLCAFGAVFPGRRTQQQGTAARLAWLAMLLGFVSLAVTTRGALLGALPPLLAVSLVALLDRSAARSSHDDRMASVAVYAVTAIAFGLAWLVARDVLRDAPEPSVWLGGRASSGTPPTFDSVIEQVFHAFAPWSALLPVAIGQLWLRTARVREEVGDGDDAEPAEAPLGLCALLWAAFGYGAQTLYLSRYGREVTFLPIVALSLLVALFLRDVERRGNGSWAAGISALFLTCLVLRDYAMYPSVPLHGMPIANFEVPKVWNPTGAWALTLGAFGGLALLGFGAPTAPERPSLSAPWHFLREQWRRGLVFKIWLVAIALGLMALAVFGALAYLIPAQLQLSTLAAKWVRRLLFVPFAIPIAVGAGQLVLFGCGKLGGARLLPMLLAGACVGVYASQVFLPALSEHFSPREIYEGYNSLAGPGEMLGEYRVGGRASGYYAKGRVVELTSVNALVDHLRGSGRRWAAFPAEELASIDRAYRKRGGQHVFVADARSARVLLATNQPVPGRANQNLLSGHVLKAPPDKIQHRIEASFDDRIQLLGYDLVTAHNGYVGGGESFKIIWYFRVLQSVPVDYRIFVHIDGEGQRIHGDHDPVEGKYPVRLWDQGDVIVDQQELEVPASDRHGDYAILMGFYSGDARLPVKSGPNDGENRVRVGVLRIQ